MVSTIRRNERRSALMLIAPFLVVYAVLFIYPTFKMLELSFTDSPLIGDGNWVYFKNYLKLTSDRLLRSGGAGTNC